MPDEASYVAAYCRRTGRDGVPNWNFYLAFSMFRLASILQGVYARGLQGNAASTYALQRGAAAQADRRLALGARHGQTPVRRFTACRLPSASSVRSSRSSSRCTSSGPSASRSVRDEAQACARKVSWLTPGGAVGLDRAIEHAQRDVRRHHLDHRDLGARRLVADRVHQVRRPHRQQPRLIDLDARLARCRGESCLAPRAVLPNATRDVTRRRIVSSARSATPISRMQW